MEIDVLGRRYDFGEIKFNIEVSPVFLFIRVLTWNRRAESNTQTAVSSHRSIFPFLIKKKAATPSPAAGTYHLLTVVLMRLRSASSYRGCLLRFDWIRRFFSFLCGADQLPFLPAQNLITRAEASTAQKSCPCSLQAKAGDTSRLHGACVLEAPSLLQQLLSPRCSATRMEPPPCAPAMPFTLNPIQFHQFHWMPGTSLAWDLSDDAPKTPQADASNTGQ